MADFVAMISRFNQELIITNEYVHNEERKQGWNWMQLTLQIDDKTQIIEIPKNILQEANDFFKMMDRDMDRGWQMSREWVEYPNLIQRCQIAADKMLSAIHSENETLMLLMAGYIVSRLPDVTGVKVDTDGEMMETELTTNS